MTLEDVIYKKNNELKTYQNFKIIMIVSNSIKTGFVSCRAISYPHPL